MKLLILTQYYPPETGAPQNRLSELAIKLRELGVDVCVLTAMPNYPRNEIYPGYEGKKYMLELINGIPVHRTFIHIPRGRSVTGRLRNYFSFVFSSARATRRLPARFDFLLCESPPLFLGYSAMYLAGKKKAKLIFNVSDLWPESAEKLGVVTSKPLLKMAYRLEARLYRRSALVTGQTQGICSDIRARFPTVKTHWLPNGADLEIFDPSLFTRNAWREENGFNAADVIFVYAGIIGIAQGLEIILDAAEAFRDNTNAKFLLVGSGPELEGLRADASHRGLSSVHFIPSVPRSEMPRILRDADYTIIPLKPLPLFLGAIPSKIFEALSMQVPVILGVDGEARQLFIEEGKCGLYFEPGNSTALISCVRKAISDPAAGVEMGKLGRQYVMEHFNRRKIAEGLFKVLGSL